MSRIEVKDVAYSYQLEGAAVPVLSNFNLTIESGEFVAIQGPSGSGKSTFLYLLGGLLKLQRGSVSIGGQMLSQFGDDSLAAFRNSKISFVFQQFHLLARSTVLHNILLPTVYKTGSKSQADLARAKHLAELLGLASYLDRLPNQLSGGQQQRVAIARALMNDPEIILADEPTGNLDTQNSKQIMDLLEELNEQGRTVVVITHDTEVAARCKKIIRVRDGKVEEIIVRGEPAKSMAPKIFLRPRRLLNWRTYAHMLTGVLPLASENLLRNKVRTFLTMIGVVIGVASVLAMITLGQFTKEKVIDSYAELGVNTLLFYGYPNWDQKAKDKVAVNFRSFDVERDLRPLRTVFPEIERMSPVLYDWGVQASFGGKIVDNEVNLIGSSDQALEISRREFLAGHNFSLFHMQNKASVCILGFEIAKSLFAKVSPLGEVLYVTKDDHSFGCRVIGILKSTSSSSDYLKPDTQIIVPYTYFQATTDNYWSAQIRQVLLQISPNIDIAQYGESIRAYFELKYGKSGSFRVDSNTVLIAQMNKFLNLFTMLLAFISFISLAVGGIGITNMMLVSVSERYREIGLRKALGATDLNIRVQFLAESMLMSIVAGGLGIILGVSLYQGLIFGATKFITKLKFEWVVNWGALLLAVISIAAVGILSGLFPALRAERLQVVDALRSE